ncbi:MAG: hypothetical protein HY810_04935 [Candidatus Omnitrophica bacterium]|nr:hypothetical protein [Candidatus Omnitrophota bacterium]
MRVEQYLRSLKYIDFGNIGLMGHSGGCSVASFMSILCPSIKTKVVDSESSFINISGLYGIYDEILPDLAGYAQLIHNCNFNPEIKKLKVSYGYVNSGQEVVEFFKRNFKY